MGWHNSEEQQVAGSPVDIAFPSKLAVWAAHLLCHDCEL